MSCASKYRNQHDEADRRRQAKEKKFKDSEDREKAERLKRMQQRERRDSLVRQKVTGNQQSAHLNPHARARTQAVVPNLSVIRAPLQSRRKKKKRQ